MRAPGQAERGEVGTGASLGVEALDPTAPPKNVLVSGEVPGLSWNAAELELDAVFELAGARVRKLTLGAHREGEAGRADEVLAGQAVHGGLRAEEDQEVLRMVHVHGEVAVNQPEGVEERRGDFVGGDERAIAGDGGHHRASQNQFRFLHLDGVT